MALRKKDPTPDDTEGYVPPVEPSPEELGENEPSPIASMERLQSATALVSRKFGLEADYHVTDFNDKGKVVKLTLDGPEFIVSVTVKNTEDHPGFSLPQ